MRDIQSDRGLEWFEGSVHVTKASQLLPAPVTMGSPIPEDKAAPEVENPATRITQGSRRHATEPTQNGLGYASLLMGILGLVTPWLPIRGMVTASPQAALWLPFLGVFFAPLAILFGLMGGARFSRSSIVQKKMAAAGLGLGVFYLVLLTGAFLFVLITNTYH